MRRLAIALLGVAILAFGLFASRKVERPDTAARPDLEPPSPPEAIERPATPPGRPLRAMHLRGVKVTMRAALDRFIAERRLDVPEYSRRRLVASLARLRRYARRIERTPYARAVLQARLDRVTAGTDRLFREKLGVGVGEFVAQSLPGDIAELGMKPRRR